MAEQKEYHKGMFVDPKIDPTLASKARQKAEESLRKMTEKESKEEETDVALHRTPQGEKPQISVKDDLEELLKEPNRDKFIIFDIETAARSLPADFEDHLKTEKVKNLVQAAAIKKNIEEFKSKYALSPITGKVVLFGCINQDKEVLQFGCEKEPMKERLIIEKAFEIIYDNYVNGGMLLSFNGKGFDLPFLLNRAIHLGIELEKSIPKALLGKYSKSHFDLMDYTEGSLAKISYLAGIDENFGSEGMLIPGWYEAGEYDKIRAKNEYDLYNSFALIKKLQRIVNIWA